MSFSSFEFEEFMAKGIVLILGIDTVLKKNMLQLESGKELGYRFLIFTNDSMGSSSHFADENCQIVKAESGYLGRLIQTWRLIHSLRNVASHVEVYPGGRFAPAYVLLAKLYSLPIVVVERGDLLAWLSSKGWLRRLLAFVYRSADIVWYKEYYMERVLSEEVRVKRLFFLPNALSAEKAPPRRPVNERTLDFVWANRLVKQRMPNWFISALSHPRLEGTKNALLGVIPNAEDPAVQEKQAHALANASARLEVREYSNPQPYFENARFFVLAADVVFGNNALFEAMSHGAIPIISAKEHTDKIVPGPKVGFRFTNEPEKLRDAMIEAASLPVEVLDEMSRSAQEHVFANFGKTAWKAKLAELYRTVRYGKT